ncbi:hypothetical protein DUI87_22986 [Hirundo rustica rustica]|uniref:Uncharacterized protein n=1 Tax=Hirundo rustica rustica TaxID=333673 RepID=A0A3M0JGW3_HIRRU|nr:hypothetical protein DUI87_22986 [Hirundo rustica rustica]
MLKHLNVLPKLRGPELDTAPKVQPHQYQVQVKNDLPAPAGHNIPDPGQDAIDPLGHLGTLLAHVFLQSPSSFQQVDTCSQISVICKFTNERLHAFIHVVNKNIEENWSQHRPLRDTAGDWPPAGCSTAHHHALGLAIQPVPNPAKSVPVQATVCQLIQ